MSRIFLSHAGVDKIKAIALKKWLVEQNPPLDNDIFLDVDRRVGIRPGQNWKEVIQQRGENCQVMVCMVSEAWESSPECMFEYAIAERWHKRVLLARLEQAGQAVSDYQWVDLFGDGPQTEVKVDYQDEDHVVSFPTRGLRRLRDAVVGHGMGADTFVWPPPNELDRAPYRGWAALDEFDAAVFFGRDAQIVRALDALKKMRESEEETLFVILGPSGAGKSSFLRAGLLPRLRRDDTNYVVLDIVRPERDDVLTGDHGLANSIHATGARLDMRQLAPGDIKQACLQDADEVGRMLYDIQQAAVAQLGEPTDGVTAPVVVLPVDQAEELFGLDAGPEASRLMDLIAQYASTEISQRVPLIVVVTIRTDHHEALQTAPQLAAVKNVVFDDLKPMPEAEFKDVIEGPARRATEGGRPLHIEPELVERLLSEGTMGADTLPLLSLTLARLYKDYSDDGLLELSEYLSMGGMSNVVKTEIESLLSRAEGPRRRELELLRRAFVPRLATFNPDNDKPVRRVAQWDAFDDEVKPLLNQFVAKRLLVKDSRKSGDVVEVALESLLEHWDDLKHWLEEERDDLKLAEILKRDSKTWEGNDRDDAYLLQGRRVQDAERLLARRDFEEHVAPAQEFVKASKARSRRRKLLVRSAAAAVVVAVLAASIFLVRFNQSQRHATAFRLLKEAEQMLEGSRAGGDVRALQQILAAVSLSPDAAESVPDNTRDELKILENPPRRDKEGVTPVRSVAISSVGNSIAWASDDRAVRVWDSKANEVHTLKTGGDSGVSRAVAFSPDGKFLASGSGDGKLLLWNADNLSPAAPPMPNPGVESIAFSRDSKWIATGSFDGTVRLWDTAGNQRSVRAMMHEPKSEVTAVGFSANGEFLFSGGTDTTVRLWNTQTGEQARPPLGNPDIDDPVTALAVNPTSDRLVVARTDGTMQLLDAHSLERISPKVSAGPNDLQSVAFSSDGNRIVTGGGDNTVRVWDAANLTQIGDPLTGHHGPVSSVMYSFDGSRIVSGGMDGSVRYWDAVTAVPIPAHQGKEIRAVAFNQDGTRVGSAGTDGTVKLWETATGKFVGQIGQRCTKDFECSINALAFDPKGARLLTGSTNGDVRVWDLNNPGLGIPLNDQTPPGRGRFTIPADLERRVKSVAFSPDGSLIAAGGYDGVVRLWDSKTLEPIAEEFAHTTNADHHDVPYQVWSVAFSPDSRRLATGSGPDFDGKDSNYLQIWTIDLSNDHPLTRDGDPINDHPGWPIYSVAFDLKGTRVAASSYDGTVRIFDIKSHDRLAILSSDQNPVSSIAFAHDERNPWLATGGTDGKVRLWDTTTYQPIGTPLAGHRGGVESVTFSPNDELILSGSADQTARLWSSPPTSLTTSICAKLTANMTHKQWDDWVAQGNPLLGYQRLCADLPVPDDD